MSEALINVEVAYALPTKQTIIDIAIKPGTTVEEAIEASNIKEQFPEIDLSATKVGIWSRVVKLRDIVSYLEVSGNNAETLEQMRAYQESYGI